MIGKAYWILNGKMWQQTCTSCCESSLFAFPGYTNPAISKFHSMMPRHCALLIPTSTILESARRSPGFKGPGVARAESVWAASKPVNSEGPRACGMPACSELALVPLEKLTKNSPMFAEHSWWIIESSFVTSLEATKSCVDLIWKKLSLVPTSIKK